MKNSGSAAAVLSALAILTALLTGAFTAPAAHHTMADSSVTVSTDSLNWD